MNPYVIEPNLSEKLTIANYNYRSDYYNFMVMKYQQLLLNIITYERDSESVVIKSTKVEYLLRYYGNAVIGLCTDNKFRLLGYVSHDSDYNIYNDYIHTLNDIITLPNVNELLLDEYIEATEETEGNFVILHNSPFYFNMSDFDIIKHYVAKLSEIELSRYSLIQQAKMNTYFRGESNDEDIKQIAYSFYNGSPIVSTTELFDPEESIITLDNYQAVNSINVLKNEQIMTKNDLHEHFGIDSAGIVKEGGTSVEEIEANNDYLNDNLLMYLDNRNEPLSLLKKYHDVYIKAISNAKSRKNITDIDKFKNLTRVSME